MRNGGNKFSSGVDVHLFHRERVLVVANHSKKPKIEIFVKRNQPQSSMTPNLHFFNTLNGDVFKAVFQARPKRPDQGKSSFIYLTIPTPSATEAKESAIRRREYEQECQSSTKPVREKMDSSDVAILTPGNDDVVGDGNQTVDRVRVARELVAVQTVLAPGQRN